MEGEDLGEHHQEKQSMLKKVKAKAKKLKDTIAKHSPGQGHDHDNPQEGHVLDDHDLDQEDDEEEDEEMVEDPEVNGAPSKLICFPLTMSRVVNTEHFLSKF